MTPAAWLCGVLLALPALGAAQVAPADFGWSATVDASPHQGLVRLPLPAGALARLQSPAAADLRVFDAQAQPVPFALTTAPQPPGGARARTAPVPALPLFAADATGVPPRGAVQLRVDDGGRGRSVWVQLDPRGTPAATAHRLQSALFDTRSLQATVTGLAVQAMLPANVPVRFTLSTSSDLATWTPLAVEGRLYRFEGPGAPANDTLELPQPLALAGRYLRLDWAGQEGVAVSGITGLLAPARPAPSGPALALPAPRDDGPTARVWELGFATPLAALDLATPQANTLVPLRVLGRNRPSDPWRLLGQVVVFRLGAPGQETTNGPLQLERQPHRWLRVEASHGARLDGLALSVRAVFPPLEIVFVAGAGGPYQLVAGRPDTPAVALPLGLLPGTTNGQPASLPVARITAVRETPKAAPPAWAAWLPAGADTRTVGLWLVLAVGVALLGGVALALLRQVNRT